MEVRITVNERVYNGYKVGERYTTFGNISSKFTYGDKFWFSFGSPTPVTTTETHSVGEDVSEFFYDLEDEDENTN
jgi:hypothetical protein